MVPNLAKGLISKLRRYSLAIERINILLIISFAMQYHYQRIQTPCKIIKRIVRNQKYFANVTRCKAK